MKKNIINRDFFKEVTGIEVNTAYISEIHENEICFGAKHIHNNGDIEFFDGVMDTARFATLVKKWANRYGYSIVSGNLGVDYTDGEYQILPYWYAVAYHIDDTVDKNPDSEEGYYRYKVKSDDEAKAIIEVGMKIWKEINKQKGKNE